MHLFAGRRLNKEWLSIHQCVDINCPVHSDNYTIQNSNGNPRTGRSPKSTVINIAEEKQSCGLQLKNVSIQEGVCHGDSTATTKVNSTTKISSVKHDNELLDADGAESICGQSKKSLKLTFMCTWLKNNVNVDNYMFYKKSVFHANQRVDRREFSLYDKHITDHIWTEHKYLGEPENAEVITERLDYLFKGIKASGSHENLVEDVGDVLKDIPNFDISDLIVKYAFLFNPDFLFKTSLKVNVCDDKYPYGYALQNEHSQKIKNDIVVKAKEAIMTQNGYTDTREQQTVNNNAVVSDCENYIESHHIPNQTVPLNFENAITNVDANQWQRTMNLNDPEHINYNSPTYLKAVAERKDFDNYNYKTHRQVNNPSIENYRYKQDYNEKFLQREFNSVRNDAKSHSVNINDAVPDDWVRNNVDMPTIVSPLVSYTHRDAKTMKPYLNVSPLVESQALSHYLSPAEAVNQLPHTGHAYHFYTCTRRCVDPRLEVYGPINATSHIDDQNEIFYNCHTPVLNSSQFHPGSRGNIYRSADSLEHDFECKDEKAGQRDCRIDYGDYMSDEFEEDPLHGMLFSKPLVSSPELYCESSDSESFYKIDDSQDDAGQYTDDVMDAFYCDDTSINRRGGDNYSCPVTSYRSESSRGSSQKYESSNSRHRSSREQFSRNISKSRERPKKTLSMRSSTRRRRSRSTLSDRKRHRSQRNVREHDDLSRYCNPRISDRHNYDPDKHSISFRDRLSFEDTESRRKSDERGGSRGSRRHVTRCRSDRGDHRRNSSAAADRSSMQKRARTSYSNTQTSELHTNRKDSSYRPRKSRKR